MCSFAEHAVSFELILYVVQPLRDTSREGAEWDRLVTLLQSPSSPALTISSTSRS